MVGHSAQGHAEPLNQQAAEDFWKGRYSRAIKGYRQALRSAPRSADLWFNLGTANAFAGQRGPAAYALEQALLLDPEHQDAEYNLEQIRQQVVDEALSKGSDGQLILPGDDDLGTGFLTAVKPRTLALLFAVSWCALFLFLWLSRRRKGHSGSAAYIFMAVLMGLLAMPSAGLILGRISTVEDQNFGVVVNERAEARRGPGKRYPLVAKVTAGVKVTLTSQDGDWRQVTLPTGADVWLPEKSVRALQTDFE